MALAVAPGGAAQALGEIKKKMLSLVVLHGFWYFSFFFFFLKTVHPVWQCYRSVVLNLWTTPLQLRPSPLINPSKIGKENSFKWRKLKMSVNPLGFKALLNQNIQIYIQKWKQHVDLLIKSILFCSTNYVAITHLCSFRQWRSLNESQNMHNW